MEVGEYFRTKDGKIGKLKKIFTEEESIMAHNNFGLVNTIYANNQVDILLSKKTAEESKWNESVIDLIEVRRLYKWIRSRRNR